MTQAKTKRRRSAKQIRADYAKLDTIDLSILKHRVEHPAMGHHELAAMVGISRSTLERRLVRPAMRKTLDDLLREPLMVIQDSMRLAAKKYVSLLNCGNESVEEKVARHLLMSGGLLKIKMEIEARTLEPFVVEDSKGAVTTMGMRELTAGTKDVTPPISNGSSTDSVPVADGSPDHAPAPGSGTEIDFDKMEGV